MRLRRGLGLSLLASTALSLHLPAVARPPSLAAARLTRLPLALRGGRALMATAATAEAAPPVEKFRKDYKAYPYTVNSVRLHFDVREHATLVTSTLSLERAPDTPAGTPLELDGDDLSLDSIALDGAPLAAADYAVSADGLVVHAPPSMPFELTSTVSLVPKENLQLSGLYESSGNLCTQCEAEGFRRITYFPDRPDVMSRYSVRVEADKTRYPVLLSNGNELARGDLDGGRHYAEFDDPFRKPSYLFALVAGALAGIEDSFTTVSGRAVRLAIWSEPENIDQLGWAMQSLKDAMAWDEKVYGREYDLDVYHIVAVNDFNMGAMENKGLNVFNTACVLAKPTTATDADYERVQAVVAHEYFHNWCVPLPLLSLRCCCCRRHSAQPRPRRRAGRATASRAATGSS